MSVTLQAVILYRQLRQQKSFPHLLSFPVIIGCLLISSGNTGQIPDARFCFAFYTLEVDSPFLNSSSEHITEFSFGQSLESDASHIPSSPTFMSLWKTNLCLLEFAFIREIVFFCIPPDTGDTALRNNQKRRTWNELTILNSQSISL